MIAAFLVAGAVFLLWPTRLTLRRPRDHVAALRALAAQDPRRAVAGGIVLAAALGLVLGGPVAAFLGAVYTALGGRALLRHRAGRRTAAVRSAALDDLAALAADLRAGLVTASTGPASSPVLSGRRVPSGRPVPGARPVPSGRPVPGARPVPSGRDARPASPIAGRIEARVDSVWRLAERTGAPAADLVERIEADARAADRAAASAAAQAAGAQATALLLAALPIGGIGLGIAIGADPVRVLLHTPLGAACAIVAVLLQAAGLMWAERLAR